MRSSFSDSLLRRGTLVVAGCGYLVIALCSLVPGEYRPHIDGWSGKEEHALAYLVLGVLTVIAARRTVNVVRLCLIIVAYAGILEFLQLFASGRHAAVGDFLASSFGGIMGIAVATVALRRAARI
jgi:VanZ family protein